jgi:hypothetical protein
MQIDSDGIQFCSLLLSTYHRWSMGVLSSREMVCAIMADANLVMEVIYAIFGCH